MKEQKEETQEVAASLATAKHISMDAAIVVFTLKEAQFFSMGSLPDGQQRA